MDGLERPILDVWTPFKQALRMVDVHSDMNLVSQVVSTVGTSWRLCVRLRV
jgi:hypothetical protein